MDTEGQSGQSQQSHSPAPTLGQWAHRTLRKQLKELKKHRSAVVAHRDPEALHQMRVRLRRLRTVCSLFAPAIELPECDRKLQQLGKRLGRVRDTDVMIQRLRQLGQDFSLTPEETHRLRRLKQRLKKQGHRRLKKLRKVLKGSSHRRLMQGLETWLEAPCYRPPARLPMTEAVPDLLLPSLGQLLLHPAWFLEPATAPAATLHDLRKAIKQMRYQMACFRQVCGPDYGQLLQTWAELQDLLGELQDIDVLQAYFQRQLGEGWAQLLPTIHHQLRRQRRQLEARWQRRRLHHLRPDHRRQLRQLLVGGLEPGGS